MFKKKNIEVWLKDVNKKKCMEGTLCIFFNLAFEIRYNVKMVLT